MPRKGPRANNKRAGGCSILLKGVMRMRITFHIGKYTVTIVICETQRKKNNRHSAK